MVLRIVDEHFELPEEEFEPIFLFGGDELRVYVHSTFLQRDVSFVFDPRPGITCLVPQSVPPELVALRLCLDVVEIPQGEDDMKSLELRDAWLVFGHGGSRKDDWYLKHAAR